MRPWTFWHCLLLHCCSSWLLCRSALEDNDPASSSNTTPWPVLKHDSLAFWTERSNDCSFCYGINLGFFGFPPEEKDDDDEEEEQEASSTASSFEITGWYRSGGLVQLEEAMYVEGLKEGTFVERRATYGFQCGRAYEDNNNNNASTGSSRMRLPTAPPTTQSRCGPFSCCTTTTAWRSTWISIGAKRAGVPAATCKIESSTTPPTRSSGSPTWDKDTMREAYPRFIIPDLPEARCFFHGNSSDNDPYRKKVPYRGQPYACAGVSHVLREEASNGRSAVFWEFEDPVTTTTRRYEFGLLNARVERRRRTEQTANTTEEEGSNHQQGNDNNEPHVEHQSNQTATLPPQVVDSDDGTGNKRRSSSSSSRTISYWNVLTLGSIGYITFWCIW